jgi:hypothetical protein
MPSKPKVKLKLYKVPFLPGNGTEVMLEVKYIAQFPKDKDSQCAYCHGDPLAEMEIPASKNIQDFKASLTYFEACPCCHGAAS